MKRNFDIGRLVAVPLFVFIGGLNVRTIAADAQALLPASPEKVIGFCNHTVVFGFYVLLIWFYLVRRRVVTSSRSLVANLIATATAFMPIFLFNVQRELIPSSTVTVAADLMILFGMGIAVYALAVLGKSFSIIPQARTLVRKGPYRFVRHPLYLGELISYSGIVLLNATLLNLFVLALIAACQLYRSAREEALLEEVFSEYREYRLQTYRLIPGII